MVYVVRVRFQTPLDAPLAGAVAALRALEIEAPTNEAAEHYAYLIVRALEVATG